MNCANHADQSAVAYCRTCGKPLCANCARNVRGVIYCENCLAAKLEGVQPPGQPATPGYIPPATPSSGPNPALAGILGAIPFGVGAVYNGQYAKGLAHLIVFTLLIIGADRAHEPWDTVFGLGIAFFVIYQIIDAVRSARAIQAGKPAPDPFGLAQTFGAGEKFDGSRIPTGAVVLIGLGVLFLLRNIGLFSFDFDRIWPIFLIALGLWLFAQRWGLVGTSQARCYCDRCRTRSLMGPAILVTIGVLSLLDSVSRFGWHRTWPLLLLVIGVVKLLQSGASGAGHITPPTIDGTINSPQAPPASGDAGQTQPPVNEVKNV
jgi:Domain of unknown function (DUF5668)/B-box zinc finger